jgi:oligopeptide transport system substrate-binding protein
MSFNFRKGKLTENLNLRKAIKSVFNVDEYVKKVVDIPGTRPGIGLVPQWVNGVSKKFRQEFPRAAHKVDRVAAKKYLELAKKELGVSQIPPLVWLTGDTPLASREAEYFQSVFKKELGIDLKIDKQIFKQRLAKMSSGEFDIVAAGWGPDYPDAMTFADLFTSWNENNRGLYKNEKVDELIRKAQATSVQKARIGFMAEAEKIILDELAILPTSERVTKWVHHDWLQGVVRHNIGPDPDFTRATVKR